MSCSVVAVRRKDCVKLEVNIFIKHSESAHLNEVMELCVGGCVFYLKKEVCRILAKVMRWVVEQMIMCQCCCMSYRCVGVMKSAIYVGGMSLFVKGCQRFNILSWK